MEADGLFVYGTLREGGRHHAWLLRTHPLGLSHAYTPGRLFHLPEAGFPAAVPGPDPGTPPPGSGWVVGEFVGYEEKEDLEAALRDLDQLEDVAGGLFERRVRPMILDSGHSYAAWVYVFPEGRLSALYKGAIEILDGDWTKYLSRRFKSSI